METLKVYEESPNTLVKMKKGPGRPKKSEAIIKDVKRRRKAEEVRGHYQRCKTSYQALIQS